MKRAVLGVGLALILVSLIGPGPVQARESFQIPSLQVDVQPASEPGNGSLALQLLFFVTILSIAPSILLMMTCFTRMVIVLSFISRALSLQRMPPDRSSSASPSFSPHSSWPPPRGRSTNGR